MNSNQIKEAYLALKNSSGSHSPSVDVLTKKISQDIIKVDACFLSNPYATDLFFEELDKLRKDKVGWRRVIEFYPPQNAFVAKKISNVLKVNHERIIVGNGGVEIIQMLIHNFIKKNICIPIPTFSPYYEYVKDDVKIHYYKLKKENDYAFDLDNISKFLKNNNIKNVVLINPNNPTGAYIKKSEIINFCNTHQHLDNIIIDESFIDFSYEKKEDNTLDIKCSVQQLIEDYNNVSIVKSMSKDFGVAGLRCGYGILAKDKVIPLLEKGYLWNISGLSNFFFQVFSEEKFQNKYLLAKQKYLKSCLDFISKLKHIENKSKKIKIYPSKANFVLIELLDGRTSFDVMLDLLSTYNIYVRDCADKIGLDGEFVRLAIRDDEENKYIIKSLENYLIG